MVKYRPTLIYSYVNVNLLYMLETSKTLNTIKYLFISKKVKDITMSNQQVAKIIYYFRFLRDYTRRVFQIERLKYSPTNSKNINLYLNNLKTLFKDKLINVRLIKLYNLIFYNNNYLSTKINILPIQKIHKEDYTTDTINYYSNKINPN